MKHVRIVGDLAKIRTEYLPTINTRALPSGQYDSMNRLQKQ
jgi:hypothetical protein